MTDEPTPVEAESAPTASGPVVSLGEAVRRTGVARSTLQRRLAAGAIAGAERNPAGGWAIPIAGLIAAGLEPRTTPADVPATVAHPAVTVEASEVERLRAELERMRAERDAARVLADERARHVEDLRAALEAMSRALGPGPAATPPGPSTEPAPRRRWWHRGPA